MENLIQIEEHGEGRVLFQYQNIICLLSNIMVSGKIKWELHYYDITKKNLVMLSDWNEKMKHLRIIDVNHLKSNIFIVAEQQEKSVLICLDLHTSTWQECVISQHILEYDEVSLQDDGVKMYFGIQNNETSDWEYAEILLFDNSICLKSIGFIKGNIKSLRIYNLCSGNHVFQCLGDNVKIFSHDNILLCELSNSATLFTYNGSDIDIITMENQDMNIESVSVWNNGIYYQVVQNEKERLFFYDSMKKNHTEIVIKDTEYVVPSYEKDYFLYTDTYIKRVSDGKKILVSEIMDSIQRCNSKLINEVPLFPDCWYFYDNWLEVEVDYRRFFFFNFNTMKSYYFENVIDICKDKFYLYKQPFYYMG